MTNRRGAALVWRKVAAAVLTLCLAVGQLTIPVRAAGSTGHPDHDTAEEFQGGTTTTEKITTNKDYYLTGDISTKNKFEILGEGVVVNLCLNGHSLTYTSGTTTNIFFKVGAGATLNIYDCQSETGSITTITNQANTSETIEIKGGYISTSKPIINNTGGTVNLHGGALTGCSSSIAVTNTGTFNMDGGMIAGCKGSTNGGAVYNNKGTFTMSGGSIIGNAGSSGGIVNNVAGGTFEMSGGEITGNSGTTGSGGVKNAGTFRLSGNAKITGNTGTSTGGGVYNAGTSAVMEITGGSITGNTAGTYGGGVYMNGTMSVAGAPVITGNTATGSGNNVYLNATSTSVSSQKTITLAGAFSGSIGVLTKIAPAYNKVVPVAAPAEGYTITESDIENFTDDSVKGDDGYTLQLDDSGNMVLKYNPQKESTPENVAIDYETEKITWTAGGTSGSPKSYLVNGVEEKITKTTASLDVNDYLGTTVSIQKKGAAATSSVAPTLDSDPVEIEVPARPAAPYVTVDNETLTDLKDGKLHGITADMEFCDPTATTIKWCSLPDGMIDEEGNVKVDDAFWRAVKDTTSTTTKVSYPVTMQVRIKASTDANNPRFSSQVATVKVEASKIAPKYSIKVTSPDFEVTAYGYDAATMAKPLTIEATGNCDVEISTVTSSNTNFVLNKKGSGMAALDEKNMEYTIAPKAGLTEGEYSANITVTYKTGGSTAKETVPVAFQVKCADQSKPSAPTQKTSTTSSISINAVAANSVSGTAAKYACYLKSEADAWSADSAAWKPASGSTYSFNSLKSGTTYCIVAQYPATTGKYNASPVSDPLEVTTTDAAAKDIKLNANGGTLTDEDGNSVSTLTLQTKGNKKLDSLPKPTAQESPTGLKFLGWYTSTSSTGTLVTLDKEYASNTTIYAHWGYSVILHLDGGSLSKEFTSYLYSTTSSTTLPTPTKEGFTFDGWYESSDFSGSKVTSIASKSTGDKTFYAKWEANTYALTWNLDGGTLNNPPTSYQYGTALSLPQPAKDGYAFGGWYTDASFSGEAVTGISSTDMGDKTFFAKWVDTPTPSPIPTPSPTPTQTPTPSPGGTPTAGPTDDPSDPTSGPGGDSSGNSVILDNVDSYEMPVISETRIPAVRLVVPESVGFIVNPYRLEVNAEHLGGGAAETGQIICPTQYLENRSEAPISVAISVTGTCADTVSFAGAPPASGGRKAAFLQLTAQAVADGQTAISAGAEKTTLSLEEAVPSPVVLSKEGGANSWLAFAFTGSVQDAPDEPWTEEDTFGAVLVFQFTLMSN